MRIAVITCYDQVEEHARPRILRRALAECEDAHTLIVKNHHQGMLRYLEVPCRLTWVRMRYRPDMYLLTFRGYEMLPLTLLLAGRKPVVFDELVNAVEYFREHGRMRAGSWFDRLFSALYGWMIRRCRYVLADTDAHAQLSAELCRTSRERYVTIPVGAEEAIFYPGPEVPHDGFVVFYYGVMKKLHGMEYFLDAAAKLSKRYKDIRFIVGGDKNRSEALYAAARRKGARLTYHPWFDYDKIIDYARAADVCVGGPFGGTPQSQFVITTKTFQFMASEIPVLIGRNRVNNAFIDKKNSLVVPQGDVQALVDAIVWAHDHPKELRAVGRAGHALYEQQFSQALITSRLNDIVEACRP